MYDTIIIGGGPAGFSAAIYLARYGVKTLLLSETMGGQIIESYDVENYPGIKKISGIELMKNMQDQAEYFGCKVISEKVTSVTKDTTFKINEKYEGKRLLVAQGLKRRTLNAKNEDKYHGLGVSYCATCDGAFFKDKIVGVVGGSDSAAEAALLLKEYAKKVYVIYRKEKLRAEKYLSDKVYDCDKIEVINNTNVVEVKGEKFVESVVFDNGKEFALDGLFIEIGFVPLPELIGQIGLDEQEGHIVVDGTQKTNVEYVWAAGDCTINSNMFNQIVTAVSEGAIAAESIYKSL